MQTRNLFGIGEIIGVITNPSEVLRSLAESKKLLEEARQEMKDNQEKKQIPKIHSFSPLPGFFDRPSEILVLKRIFSGVPSFVVLFGASSVGKTALLREILYNNEYHVLNFDLRIAGFADITSLYLSLSTQLESYFAEIPNFMGRERGWGEFEKESWAFKHDRSALLLRLEAGGQCKPSDIAHLMELYQSALLKYWEFTPMTKEQREKTQKLEAAAKKEHEDNVESGRLTKQFEKALELKAFNKETADAMDNGLTSTRKMDLHTARSVENQEQQYLEDHQNGGERVTGDGNEEKQVSKPPTKRIPVFFIDEAHKLPALIDSQDTMKAFLDALLVLTKQDRLTHVIQSTSDSFYMHWLRQLNVMQHSTIITVGDCSKAEAKAYFEAQLLPYIPEELSKTISFEEIYCVFGGKLAHMVDYVSEFINSDGRITPLGSSHFRQAYTLLNLQIIHSIPEGDRERGAGLPIYSPLMTSEWKKRDSEEGVSPFSYDNLMSVIERFQAPECTLQDAPIELEYFSICKELGVKAVDGMVKGKLLELRWGPAVTPEGELTGHEPSFSPVLLPATPVLRKAMNVAWKKWNN